MRNQMTAVFEKLIRKARRNWEQGLAFARMLRAFLPHIRKQKNRIIAAQLFGLGYILFDLLEPWPLKVIFDSVFLGKPLPTVLDPFLGGLLETHRVALLNILIGMLIANALLQGFCYYFEHLFTSMSAQQVLASVRLALYSHVQYLSISFHDRRRLGDLMSRLTTDIRILRDMLVSMPVDSSSKFLLSMGMIIVMFIMDEQLTFVALIVVPMLALLLKKYQRPMRQIIREQRAREGQLASVATEVLGAMKVVAGFNREDTEIERFQRENKSSLRKGLRAARLEARFKWASELSIAVATAAVIGVAARRVLMGALSPGEVLVFIAYLRVFYRPLRRVSQTTERMARATASGERVLDMLAVEQTMPSSAAFGRPLPKFFMKPI
jgi:ATP-binding cassette subfamily B protein